MWDSEDVAPSKAAGIAREAQELRESEYEIGIGSTHERRRVTGIGLAGGAVGIRRRVGVGRAVRRGRDE